MYVVSVQSNLYIVRAQTLDVLWLPLDFHKALVYGFNSFPLECVKLHNFELPYSGGVEYIIRQSTEIQTAPNYSYKILTNYKNTL